VFGLGGDHAERFEPIHLGRVMPPVMVEKPR
jgi:hypothetical protein